MHSISTSPTCSSMTGYARTQYEFSDGSLVIELKSVNSRFLDVSFRLPDELRAFEPLIRDKITSFVLRGKIECRLSLHLHQEQLLTRLTPQPLVLARLRDWQSEVLELHAHAAPLSVADLLRWPGVLEQNESNSEFISSALKECLEECLVELQNTRRREGKQLGMIVLQRCLSVRELIQQLQTRIPTIRAAQQKKTTEKLSEALGLVAPHGVTHMSKEEIAQRLSCEIALYALRNDVDEELERLQAHVIEVERVLCHANSNPIGKRLDFLMQELHREANTLGSKASTLDLSQTALEIKLLIEQMREQVQNIE